MSALTPCPSCGRHVRLTERACPFCATAIDLRSVAPRALPTQRLGRAALVTFGAIAMVTAPGCGTATQPDDGGHDAYVGGAVDAYGAPADAWSAPVDAGTDGGAVAAYGGPMFDANLPDSGTSALYGAPPPPPAPEQP